MITWKVYWEMKFLFRPHEGSTFIYKSLIQTPWEYPKIEAHLAEGSKWLDALTSGPV